jgi:branched-chain amino acid transport system substrate-binding protein
MATDRRAGWTRRGALSAMTAAVVAPRLIGRARAADKEPFTFAVALPTTGVNAAAGSDQVLALQWAVDDVNAAGGANGRPLKLLVVDTQANPKIGIDMVTQLVSIDKVPLIVIAYSGVVAATAPIANRTQTLMLVTGANSPRIATMGDYVYTTYPLANVDVTILAQYAYQTLHKTRAAVLYINDEAGIYGARIFRDTFKKEGGDIVAFESYEPNASDYTGAVLKVKAASPELVHLHGNSGDTPQAIQQLRQLGVACPITSYAAAYNPRLLQQLGSLANGLIVGSFAPGPWDSKAVDAYRNRWIKEKGREPDLMPTTQFVHDDAWIVKRLVEKLDGEGKPLTGENLRTALLDIGTFDKLPLIDSVTIQPDHTVRLPLYLLEAKDGAFVPLGKFG